MGHTASCENENCEPCRSKLIDPVRDVVRVNPALIGIGTVGSSEKAPAWPGWQEFSTPWPQPEDPPADVARLTEPHQRMKESPEQRQDREVLEWRRVEVVRQVQESARRQREAERQRQEAEETKKKEEAVLREEQRTFERKAEELQRALEDQERYEREKLDCFLRQHGFESVLAKRRRRLQAMYPLHVAVTERDAEVISILLKHRANPEQRNSRRETPLNTAMRFNKNGSHEEVLRALGAGE
mmetsp:Transcript_5894/g.14078  ORF Transcript_5894/g.14078 Transcript_5894/m.14078 type:complete len:242 (-) Transcript_5894:29-754(-)